LSSVKIPIPRIKSEQTAIATALSDADALISGLEKLIAKKRYIKQGAMQKLLQPKEGWEVKKLGEVFIITAGGDLDVGNFSLIEDDKYCYPIYSNALTNKGLYGYTSQYKQFENTITVTARGQVGVAVPRDHKYCAIGRVLMLTPSIELDINFISECINNYIEFSNESTGVPQLTAPQISKYEITIPEFKEQTRIATILSDMDAEINALETKLEKYRKVKLGMMQNLLTGKIRLV
jgi:type I restriction enzyme S subunit